MMTTPGDRAAMSLDSQSKSLYSTRIGTGTGDGTGTVFGSVFGTGTILVLVLVLLVPELVLVT